MNLIRKYIESTWSEITNRKDQVFDNDHADSSIHRGTSFSVWLNQVDKTAELDWFSEKPWQYQDKIWLPTAHNLAVNTGLHIAAQRAFGDLNDAGSHVTSPVAGSTQDRVDAGGVDNNTSAVAATTTQFDTTGGNRFIVLFDSNPTYSTGNRRITALYSITNSDTTIVHRRYGLTNDLANAANTLFSMLSGFILDFNSKAYDITVESQTNFTGS